MSLLTSDEGIGAAVARRVNTVNVQPGKKTVGCVGNRYRLRRNAGIGGTSSCPNRGRGRRPLETGFGTRRLGNVAHGQPLGFGVALLFVLQVLSIDKYSKVLHLCTLSPRGTYPLRLSLRWNMSPCLPGVGLNVKRLLVPPKFVPLFVGHFGPEWYSLGNGALWLMLISVPLVRSSSV